MGNYIKWSATLADQSLSVMHRTPCKISFLCMAMSICIGPLGAMFFLLALGA